MLIMRFIHDENKLYVGDKIYKATCPVRNELNGERSFKFLPRTFPAKSGEIRKFYQPRKFPTGSWEVTGLEWTEDPTYAPVKIKTNAVRAVFVYDGKNEVIGIQEDSCYHIHFGVNSLTTHGCIRANSAEDAEEQAKMIKSYLDKKEKVYLEVIASRKCERK